MDAILADLMSGEYPPDKTLRPVVLRTIWILLAVSGCFLIARIWAKLKITRRLYYDDIIMALSWLFGLIHAALTTAAAQQGLGRHLLYLSAEERTASIYWGLLSLCWGWASPTLGRVAVLITMLFLTGTDPRTSKWPAMVFIALQVVVNAAVIILFYTQCGPDLSVFWGDQQIKVFEKCLDPQIQTDFGYFAGSFNTLTDAFLTVLPAILILHANLTLRKKITLGLVLCLSVLALVAAIVKTYEAKMLSSVVDYTYDLCTYVIWLSIELNVVIIAGCIPFLRPLFSRATAPTWEPERPSHSRWESISMDTMFKKGGNTRSSRLSSASEENMMDRSGSSGQGRLGDATGIVVTREVEVLYQPNDVPFVHAALVGLMPGNIARAGSVRRR